jgi:hypothetical protein
VSFTAITLCVASQRVFIVIVVYFLIDSVRKLLDTLSYWSFLCNGSGFCYERREYTSMTWKAKHCSMFSYSTNGNRSGYSDSGCAGKTEPFSVTAVNCCQPAAPGCVCETSVQVLWYQGDASRRTGRTQHDGTQGSHVSCSKVPCSDTIQRLTAHQIIGKSKVVPVL